MDRHHRTAAPATTAPAADRVAPTVCRIATSDVDVIGGLA